jgi:hypothetical protein
MKQITSTTVLLLQEFFGEQHDDSESPVEINSDDSGLPSRQCGKGNGQPRHLHVQIFCIRTPTTIADDVELGTLTAGSSPTLFEAVIWLLKQGYLQPAVRPAVSEANGPGPQVWYWRADSFNKEMPPSLKPCAADAV